MTLRQTPLADAHAAADASTTEFGGWEMPVDFGSIREEHRAVRESVGAFDVSHMGEVAIAGPDAVALTDRLVTNDVAGLEPGRAAYAGLCTESGVLLDDVVVYRLPEAWDVPVLVVPNAGHDGEATERWREHAEAWDLEATVENRTEDYGLLAVQGPEAVALVDDLAASDADLEELGRFRATTAAVAGVRCLVSRTGYTGEDGLEVLCPWAETPAVWDALECQRCGLGARDTLRMEMGYLLSGQDFDPETEARTPLEAGIGFAVDFEAGEFVGRNALAEDVEDGPAERFVGLQLEERGVPRHGYPIVHDGEAVGTVTSGTMSPSLGEPIGLGYVPAELASEGTALAVEVRGEPKQARAVVPPFLPGYE